MNVVKSWQAMPTDLIELAVACGVSHATENTYLYMGRDGRLTHMEKPDPLTVPNDQWKAIGYVCKLEMGGVERVNAAL